MTVALATPSKQRPHVRVVHFGAVGLRLDTGVLSLAGVALVAVVVVAAWGMTLGSFAVPVDEVVKSILGQGQRENDFIVLTLRLPRVLSAVFIGALLAMSGAIFQGLVRNPLVSPDLIGINAGAGLVAVAWIVTRQDQAILPVVSFGGAVTAAAAVYVLSWTGHLAGTRLVLVGIGFNAMLSAATTFLIVRYPIEQVSSAVLWMAGTVYGADWNDVRVLGLAVLVLGPLAVGLMWSLRILQLGDTTAQTLGLPLERTRLGLAVVGCALCATAVSIGGGIGFVAFMVPHLARMLAGPMTGGVMLLTAILGGLLLVGADQIGQHVAPVALPVGVVTAALGAPYFLILLWRTECPAVNAASNTLAGPPVGDPVTSRLQAERLSLAYGPLPVVHDLSLAVADGRITSIIGPNGCGKSTLLRGLVRLLKPRGGTVLLDGQAIHHLPTKAVARELGLLPQGSTLPEAVTVEDLVRRGRYPHQGMFQAPTRHDQVMVERALELAGVTDIRSRPVDELSGGQRQRAWIAMTLAQDTPVLLLDEPTTFLDIAHQQEVLDLVVRLNRLERRTIVLVLHDVNDAARISDHIVAMREGVVAAEGAPADIVTPTVLESIFGVVCDVVPHPRTGLPVSVPRSRASVPAASHPLDTGSALRAERLSSGYGARTVVREVSVRFPRGRISAIVGPNASGKSTLLKTLARLLPVTAGEAWLGQQRTRDGTHRSLARQLAMLAQGPIAPPGVLVEDLVAAGRYPYQRWYRQWSAADERAVDHALAVTDLQELRLRAVDTLSGGQRQRVWVALALAQETPLLLLDEPTTFLDIAHQVELMDLVHELNVHDGRTVVMVLHDLSQACRYADHVVAMQDGRVVDAGDPRTVVTEALVSTVFGMHSWVVEDPLTGKPLVLPDRLADPARQHPAQVRQCVST